MRELNEIFRDMEQVKNMSCKPDFQRPRIGAVIDEEKSVRWNREEVARLQEKFDSEVKRLNTLKNEQRDIFTNELYKTIRFELKDKITIEQAKGLYAYVHDNNYNDGFAGIRQNLEELLALIKNIL